MKLQQLRAPGDKRQLVIIIISQLSEVICHGSEHVGIVIYPYLVRLCKTIHSLDGFDQITKRTDSGLFICDRALQLYATPMQIQGSLRDSAARSSGLIFIYILHTCATVSWYSCVTKAFLSRSVGRRYTLTHT